MKHRYVYLVMLFIIALSGFCALIYQVVWERVLEAMFGGDAVSSSVITGTFILGLGLGAYLFRCNKNKSIVTYAKIEFLIGVIGILSHGVISRLSSYALQYSNAAAPNSANVLIYLIVTCIICLLPPCILIGATLPLVFKTIQNYGLYQRSNTGIIYGVNTFGACLGILSAPFLFLNHISLPSTLYITGTLNIIIAALLMWINRWVVNADKADIAADEIVIDGEIDNNIILLCFVSGFIGLSIEITFFRMASVYWPSSAYNFPLILVSYLFALSLGSAIFARLTSFTLKSFHLRLLLLLLLAATGLIVGIWARSIMIFNPNIIITLGQYLLITFPFVLFQGAIFPVLLVMTSRTGNQLAINTGTLYLINSVGAFCGAMITQFIGYTYFGTKSIILFNYYILLIASLYYGCKNFQKRLFPLFIVMMLLPFAIDKDSWDLYIFGETGDFERVEGVTGVATIDWNENKTAGAVYVNHQLMSALPDHLKHIRLAIFPLSMWPRQMILVLGLGGGGMVRELAKDPAVEEIDVIDWSYELPILLNGPHARKLLNDVFLNPKVKLVKADARLAISLFADKKYNVIVDNLSSPEWVGATSIKSRQYYQEIARILTDGGTFVYDFNDSNAEIISGLIKNFNYVYFHKVGVVLATDRPVKFDADGLETALSAREKIKELGIEPQQYQEWMVDQLDRLSSQDFAHIKPVDDDELYNEYYLRLF